MKRFPVSFLGDVVYFAQPMPKELAETIRTLRRDHGLDYSDVMWALSESDPDAGQCYGFGKALSELACRELNDYDPNWK
jgi:hypothetical protein